MTPRQDPTTVGRLYGRGQLRSLRKGQALLMEQVYPNLSLHLPETIPGAPPPAGDFPPAVEDPRSLFAAPVNAVWLEIGCGSGEHLAAQAQAHPDVGLIGCEPFLNGMAALVSKVHEQQLGNVRVHRGDALDVLRWLPDGCLDRVFLLHPDPWPKWRHAKRRFVNPGPLALLAARMTPGAQLRIGTDHPVYMHWTLEQLLKCPNFAWTAESPADWTDRPDDWPITRYESKARQQGKPVWYFTFVRRPDQSSGTTLPA